MNVHVRTACAAALAKISGPLDGHCLDVCEDVRDRLRRVGIRAALVCRDEPSHESGHWTVRVRGAEYDPTIGYAEWSRGLPVKRGALHVVTPRSPHRRWPEL